MTVITIDPVTRIEGHARVVFELDARGKVASARLVVNELRGFERILVGMEADRMPLITARICGVCPSAHHLAAVHALDALTNAEPPKAARLLRELLYMGHVIHSHALSLFVLQGPDLVLGLSEPAASRNIAGVVAKEPETAKKALRLRSLGQKINELIGGRGVHPVTAVAGGICFALDTERLHKLEAWSVEALELSQVLVPVARDLVFRTIERHPELVRNWVVPTYQVATIADGESRFCHGPIVVADERGTTVAEFPVREYDKHFSEVTTDYSYLKPVFALAHGEENTSRVGPLARVNCAARLGTKQSDLELTRMKREFGSPCHLTVMQTWARAIELLYAAERAVEIINDPAINGPTRVETRMRAGRGVGHVEAPRGTLIHDYEVDDRGIVTQANLIVATQHNYAAINRSLMQAMADGVSTTPDDALLNLVEFSIRCYDPCLSCATHAIGQMPLEILICQHGAPTRRIARRP